MYLAELKGKLSSKLENMEDLLTSNVFSFFKYSNRKVYLRNLLKLIDIDTQNQELSNAIFIFWPIYENKTEPDLVIIVGDYYILIEAKYFSDFGDAVDVDKKQINREITGGLIEAKSYNKKFKMIAITAHYNYPRYIFSSIPSRNRGMITWLTTWAMRERIWAGDLPVIQFPGGRKQYIDIQDIEQFISKNKRTIQ